MKLKSEINMHTYQIHIVCSQRVWALDVAGKSFYPYETSLPINKETQIQE